MDKSTYEQSVIRILNEHLPEPLTAKDRDCRLMDRGLDSLAFVEVIIALEQEYGIAWPPEYLAMDVMDTPGEIIKVLDENIRKDTPV